MPARPYVLTHFLIHSRMIFIPGTCSSIAHPARCVCSFVYCCTSIAVACIIRDFETFTRIYIKICWWINYAFKNSGDCCTHYPECHFALAEICCLAIALLNLYSTILYRQKFTSSHPAKVGGRSHRYVLKLNHFHVSPCRCPSYCQNITKY